MSSKEGSDQVYQPEDAVANATRTTGIAGGAGLALAAIQNTLARSNIGAMGLFTKVGGTTVTFSMIELA